MTILGLRESSKIRRAKAKVKVGRRTRARKVQKSSAGIVERRATDQEIVGPRGTSTRLKKIGRTPRLHHLHHELPEVERFLEERKA